MRGQETQLLAADPCPRLPIPRGLPFSFSSPCHLGSRRCRNLSLRCLPAAALHTAGGGEGRGGPHKKGGAGRWKSRLRLRLIRFLDRLPLSSPVQSACMQFEGAYQALSTAWQRRKLRVPLVSREGIHTTHRAKTSSWTKRLSTYFPFGEHIKSGPS